MIPKFVRLVWTYDVENGTNRNPVPTFLFYFYTHYRPIFHHLATILNVADRAMAIGYATYAIASTA